MNTKSALRECNCAEGRYCTADTTGAFVEVKAPPVHDCAYIRRRNALLPQAVMMSNVLTSRSPRDTFAERWSGNFAEAMRELAEKELGGVS